MKRVYPIGLLVTLLLPAFATAQTYSPEDMKAIKALADGFRGSQSSSQGQPGRGNQVEAGRENSFLVNGSNIGNGDRLPLRTPPAMFSGRTREGAPISLPEYWTVEVQSHCGRELRVHHHDFQ